jgi:opacity protein-like surface antigen
MINTVNTAFLTTTTAFVSAPGNPKPDQQGGGAWSRVIAGTIDTKTSSTATVDASAAGLPSTGVQNCNTVTRQDYWGTQAGRDFSILNGGATGANWHIGFTAGYFESKTKDITGAGSFTNPNFPAFTFSTPAGSLVADTEVPFAGIYTAFTKGGFFLDGQVRFDLFQNTLTDRNNGLSGQALDARGLSLTVNAGYNIPLGGGWFIEPSGGVVWSRVSIDPLNVAGVEQTAAPFAPYARGTVTVEDIESILGRATVRVGTNFTAGNVAWQPFLTASVFHEFAGDVVSRSVASGTGNVFIDGVVLTSRSSGGVGTYGQFALGTAAAVLNTGWLGYARVDYRTGEDVEGWSVNAGMRYQFSPEHSGSVKDAPGISEDYNWTGFYAGGSAGALWGRESWLFTDATGAPFSPAVGVRPDYAGYLLGGQVGYNHQIGRMVVGVEADYGWSNAHGGVSCPNLFFFTCGAEVEQMASVTGRLGYAWGRALLYAKGGWAFADVTPAGSQNTNLVPLVTPVISSKWLSGATFGAGMEFALTNHMSVRAEWTRFNLGSEVFQVSDGPEFADVSANGNTVRLGVNFHLNPLRREAPLK